MKDYDLSMRILIHKKKPLSEFEKREADESQDQLSSCQRTDKFRLLERLKFWVYIQINSIFENVGPDDEYLDNSDLDWYVEDRVSYYENTDSEDDY